MVIGLGIDMVEVDRIRASLERFGDRFLARVFTDGERVYCARKRFPAQHLAARFAAKEAAAKALGTGLSSGVGWHDFEVIRLPGRPPRLTLSGRAQQLALALGVARISLSLTHTEHYATAVAVFEDAVAGLAAEMPVPGNRDC